MQVKRLLSLLTIAGSLPLSLASAAPGPGPQDISYDATSLVPRDLVKRLSIEKWATRCWGFDLANLAHFNPLHLGNDIQDFLTSLVPIMSSPCFPVAATVLKCSFKDDIIPFLLGGRPEFQNPSEEAECYCEDRDFPEVVTKCFQCGCEDGNNGGDNMNMAPWTDVLNQTLSSFCSGGGSDLNLSGLQQKQEVSAAPSASNVVISSGTTGPSGTLSTGAPESSGETTPSDQPHPQQSGESTPGSSAASSSLSTLAVKAICSLMALSLLTALML